LVNIAKSEMKISNENGTGNYVKHEQHARASRVQMKYLTTAHGETAEEATTHELGHWQGLPHTWDKNSHVTVIITQLKEERVIILWITIYGGKNGQNVNC